MKKKHIVLVVAPHPDDETLGCGGTLLKHAESGDELHWCIATKAHPDLGFSESWIASRTEEIKTVTTAYSFTGCHQFEFPTTRLDTIPQGEIVKALVTLIKEINPTIVYLPFRGDAHSDHGIVFDCAVAATKSFRAPCVEKIMCYEVSSETDFGLGAERFRPNVYVDISPYLEKKLKTMSVYESEVMPAPGPRSIENLRARAVACGGTAGFHAAEPFMLVRERQKLE